jgi:hypothetical protein
MGPLRGQRFVSLLIRHPMLILKRRSRSVIFSIRTLKSTLFDFIPLFSCNNARSHLRVYPFLTVLFSFHLRYRFYLAHISYHWRILFPCSRIKFSIDSYLLLLSLMLIFFCAFPSIPLAVVTSSSHIAYSNSVQHHPHSDFLHILNPYSVHLFVFYSFVHNVEGLCIRSCSFKGLIDGRL